MGTCPLNPKPSTVAQVGTCPLNPKPYPVVQVGTPITIPSQGGIDLGRIASMELNHKAVDIAKRGDSVAMKLEPTNTTEGSRLYGRHFDFKVRCCLRCCLPQLDRATNPVVTLDDWREMQQLIS